MNCHLINVIYIGLVTWTSSAQIFRHPARSQQLPAAGSQLSAQHPADPSSNLKISLRQSRRSDLETSAFLNHSANQAVLTHPTVLTHETGVVILYWICFALLCIAFTCALCYVMYKVISLILVYRKLHGFKKRDFQDFARYRFENWFKETPHANLKIVMIVAAIMLVVGAPIHSMLRQSNIFFSIWKVWCLLADPGTAVSMKTDGSSLNRIMELGFSAMMGICGLFIFSLLVAMVGDSFSDFQTRVEEGHSEVMESGHVMILGFQDATCILIQELCYAHEEAGGATIVVMDDKFSKAEMEQRIQDSEIEMGVSRVIIRTGKAHHTPSLRKAGAHTAQTIIILEDGDEPKEVRDAFALRILCTLRGKSWPVGGNIIAQCSLAKNFDLFKRIGGDVTSTVMIDFFLARLMVQCSKNSGLSTVFNEFLGFQGSEFYLQKVPKHLSGISFSQAHAYYTNAVPIGILTEGACHLCPGRDYTMSEAEEIVLFAENRSSSRIAETVPIGPMDIDAELVAQVAADKLQHRSSKAETVVIIGWNGLAVETVYQLDLQVASGSQLHILEQPNTKINAKSSLEKTGHRINQKLENFTHVEIHEGLLASRYAMEELSDQIEEASRIFLFSDLNAKSHEHADALTITSVLHIYQIFMMKNISKEIAIIPEIRDPLSKTACFNFKMQDFVDSVAFPSQIMASIAYQPEVMRVLSDIVSPDQRSSFSITKLSDFMKEGQPMRNVLSFYEVSAIVGSSGDVAIGWSKPHHETREATELNSTQREFHRQMASVIKETQSSNLLHEYEFNPADKLSQREWSWEDDRVVVITTSHDLRKSGSFSRERSLPAFMIPSHKS